VDAGGFASVLLIRLPLYFNGVLILPNPDMHKTYFENRGGFFAL